MTKCTKTKTKNIRIVQGNLHRSETATTNLYHYLTKNRADIALIQEPNAKKRKIYGFNRLKGNLFSDIKSDRPRTCIFVKKNSNLTAFVIPKFCNQDLTTIRLEYKKDNRPATVIMASAYLPYPEPQRPAKMFKDLVEFCGKNKLELIIGSDANAHHTIWGSKDVNPRGKILSEYLSSTNLMLLNVGNTPTFVNKIREEVIDISLASPIVERDVRKWEVSPEVTLSDHRWITFEIASDNEPPKKFRNPRKTNWEQYSNLLQESLNFVPTASSSVLDIDEKCNNLQRLVMNAYETSCPLSVPPPETKIPGWTKELEELKKATRTSFNGAYNDDPNNTWDQHKKHKREYKKACRNARRRNWKDFTNEVKPCKPMAKLKKALAKDPYQPEVITKEDGTPVTSSEEALEALLTNHFPGIVMNESDVDNDRAQNETQGYKPRKRDWVFAEKLVTAERVRWAISTFLPYKSPGMDKIIPVLIQKAGEPIVSHLVDLFKASLAFSYNPIAWQDVRVVFIPKPGKDSYAKPDSYRPISLTSFLLKILERIIDRYVRDEPLKNKPLSHKQHAYIAGKSVDTAIHRTVYTIEKALKVKQKALGGFLDMEGAFNKVTFQSVNESTTHFGVNETAGRWIDTMLKSRRVIAQYANSCKSGAVTRGCPQGGVLSPILWNMVMDSLLRELDRKGLNPECFADDLLILLIGMCENTLCSLMNTAFAIVEKWCVKNGLTVNPDKSKLVLFTNKRKIEKVKLPTLFGKTLQFSDKVKFLGFILDKKLNWNEHIKERIRKATKIFWQCRRAFSKNWGLKPNVIYWLYTAIIRPILCYGCHIWHERVKIESIRNDLQHVQRMVLLGVTGAMSTTATAALEVLLSITPIDLYIEQEAIITSLRIKAANCWSQLSVGHTASLERYSNSIPELLMSTDKCAPEYYFDKTFDINIPERSEWENIENMFEEQGVTVYTDGSKMDSGSGAGVYSVNPPMELSYPLGVYASVYQAEIFAILKSAEKLQDENVMEKTIYICSDSQASLKALSSYCFSSKLTIECLNSINNLTRNNTVHLIWVPGHSDVEGNEKADELARKGSETQIQGQQCVIGIPYIMQRSAIRKYFANEHVIRWEASETCKHTKGIVAGPNQRNTKYLLQCTRSSIRELVGTLTGHCKLNKHMYTLRHSQTPTCRRCDEENETPLHWLSDCPALTNTRMACFGNYFMDFQLLKTANIKDIHTFMNKAMESVRSTT